jgi:hypothetical protein
MKRASIISGLLLIALAMGPALHAKAKKNVGGVPAASTGMGGTFGAGVAMLPSYKSEMPALTADFWVMDSLAVEALLGVGTGSQYNGGTDGSGNPAMDGIFAFGLGAGARWVFAAPSEHLLLQGVARLNYANNSQTSPVAGSNTVTTRNIFGVYVGAGFEGFLPVWDALSLEVNAGLKAQFPSSTVAPPVGASRSYSESSIELGGDNTFIPANIALHYYFK